MVKIDGYWRNLSIAKTEVSGSLPLRAARPTSARQTLRVVRVLRGTTGAQFFDGGRNVVYIQHGVPNVAIWKHPADRHGGFQDEAFCAFWNWGGVPGPPATLTY